MPIFVDAGGARIFQLQPGEISCGYKLQTANTNSGFRQASPDLYWRQTPYNEGELYKLGLPWPLSAFSNDQTFLLGEADEWRIFQGFHFIDDGSIHGAVDLTEADDAVSSTGALLIQGTLSSTEANDTLAATATLAIKGTASITEAGDTVSATGTLALKGAASITEANDTLAATATLAIKGTLSATDANDTLAATGTLVSTGTLSVVEQDDTPLGGGAVEIKATLSVVEVDDTLASNAIVPLFYARRGGWDERQEFERRQREWQESLRPIIDRSFRIANGEIDPITFEPIPPPDYSMVNAALAAQQQALDRQRIEAFMAAEQRRQEDDAIAVLLLAA